MGTVDGVSQMPCEMYNCRPRAEKLERERARETERERENQRESETERWRRGWTDDLEVGEMSRREAYGSWPTTMHCYASWTCPL